MACALPTGPLTLSDGVLGTGGVEDLAPLVRHQCGNTPPGHPLRTKPLHGPLGPGMETDAHGETQAKEAAVAALAEGAAMLTGMEANSQLLLPVLTVFGKEDVSVLDPVEEPGPTTGAMVSWAGAPAGRAGVRGLRSVWGEQ